MIDILYLHITHSQWQQLSIKTLESHLINKGKIFTLDTNQSIFQFLKNTQTTQNIIIIEQNMGILKDTNALNIPITYQFQNKNYIQDHLKPQIINKEIFLKLPEQQYELPLTEYYKSIDRVGIPNNSFIVNVTKPICCTTKSLLTVKQYVKWNEKGFQSLKKYLNL